jgi:hypothetical protein
MLKQHRVVGSVTVLLFVGSVLPTNWAQTVSALPYALVWSVLTPLRSPLHMLAISLRSPADLDVNLGNARQIEDQLIEARVLLAQKDAELIEAKRVIAILTEVRRQYPLRGVQLVPATVVDLSVRPRRLAIKLGRGHGIGLQMAVTDGGNLIGRIGRVGPVSADVWPITATGTSLAVRIDVPSIGRAARGVAVMLQANGDGLSLNGRVDVGSVKTGQWAYLDDPEWPRDVHLFVVGIVDEVAADESDPTLHSRVRIKPIRSFARLRAVQVVLPPEAQQADERP